MADLKKPLEPRVYDAGDVEAMGQEIIRLRIENSQLLVRLGDKLIAEATSEEGTTGGHAAVIASLRAQLAEEKEDRKVLLGQLEKLSQRLAEAQQKLDASDRRWREMSKLANQSIDERDEAQWEVKRLKAALNRSTDDFVKPTVEWYEKRCQWYQEEVERLKTESIAATRQWENWEARCARLEEGIKALSAKVTCYPSGSTGITPPTEVGAHAFWEAVRTVCALAEGPP